MRTMVKKLVIYQVYLYYYYYYYVASAAVVVFSSQWIGLLMGTSRLCGSLTEIRLRMTVKAVS